MKRISRGTPYVLSSTDMEHALAALSPRMEGAVAAILNMTVADWREQDDRLKVKQLIDFQNSAQLAATLATAAKAQTDLEDLPEALGTHVPREIVDLLDALISDEGPAAGRIARWLAEVVRG